MKHLNLIRMVGFFSLVLAFNFASCKQVDDELIYVNIAKLQQSKKLIESGNPIYRDAYHKLLENASEALLRLPNPVTNKNQMPPSGSKHDYWSIAPYRWPNPETTDGMPWVLKDGKINPMYRGDEFDSSRLFQMFADLENLWLAYYFSNEVPYANAAKQIIETWFLDDSTSVNPNVNFGQSIPGEVDGRRAGIIEWMKISNVITTVQVLIKDDYFSIQEIERVNDWFREYYHWLKTNPMGIANDNGLQNHSTCYDYQMVGLACYLGYNKEARARLEAVKSKRIAIQIKPDGTQPFEMGRTRSVHYASENLLVMSKVADMGFSLGVDLWGFTTDDGRSMQKAFEFLYPYAIGQKEWSYKEIGGAEKIIIEEMIPLFAVANSIFQEDFIFKNIDLEKSMGYSQLLYYPLTGII